MFLSSLRRFWAQKPGRFRRTHFAGNGRLFFRPRLEPLEDRVTPSALTGGIWTYATEAAAARFSLPTGPATPTVVGGLKPLRRTPPEVGSPMAVTYEEDSPAARIDLGAAFGAVGGIRREDGLQLAMLGNTNPALVKASISEQELTLTFAPGKFGKATLTLSATDADGVSAQETIVISVLPRLRMGAGEPPAPTGMKGW
jgi:hypothetical protein